MGEVFDDDEDNFPNIHERRIVFVRMRGTGICTGDDAESVASRFCEFDSTVIVVDNDKVGEVVKHFDEILRSEFGGDAPCESCKKEDSDITSSNELDVGMYSSSVVGVIVMEGGGDASESASGSEIPSVEFAEETPAFGEGNGRLALIVGGICCNEALNSE